MSALSEDKPEAEAVIVRVPVCRLFDAARMIILPTLGRAGLSPMSLPGPEKQQVPLFEDDRYKYRIFVSDRKQKAYTVIEEYDGRADAENLVGEVKREGLSAIPSAKFKNNYAFFCIVMLAYNIWRWMKLVAAMTVPQETTAKSCHPLSAIAQNTLRVARLVLLLIAAKIVYSANRVKVRYSTHDARVPPFFYFLRHLDYHRGIGMPEPSWHPNCQPPYFPMQEISCTKSSANAVQKAEKDTS